MNQGKLEVVKQEMARVNIDILGIRELKWTGMGEFNSDDHYIYYCGQDCVLAPPDHFEVGISQFAQCTEVTQLLSVSGFVLQCQLFHIFHICKRASEGKHTETILTEN